MSNVCGVHCRDSRTCDDCGERTDAWLEERFGARVRCLDCAGLAPSAERDTSDDGQEAR